MSRVVVVSMIRNEADRFLESALVAWDEFADKIVIVDDNSTDDSRVIARSFSKVRLHHREELYVPAWGDEAPARAELFDVAMKETEPGDFLLWLDADMTPLRDPRPLFSDLHDTYAFPLYDLWTLDADRPLYREDAMWYGHRAPRAWAIRRPESFEARWNRRGVHCGHLPANWQGRNVLFAPCDYGLLHYGYAAPHLRAEKLEQYRRLSHQLTEAERHHAESIGDETPNLKPLNYYISWPLATPATVTGSDGCVAPLWMPS